MPYAPKRPCNKPHCPNLVSKGYCEEHKKPRFGTKDRPNSTQRGYGHKWQQARAGYLRKHPICTDPFGYHGGRPTPATVVDHIEPHKGDMELFWDFENNVQSLCAACHNTKTAKGY